MKNAYLILRYGEDDDDLVIIELDEMERFKSWYGPDSCTMDIVGGDDPKLRDIIGKYRSKKLVHLNAPGGIS